MPSRGLISTGLTTDPLQNVRGYDPSQIELDDRDTVAGQLNTLLSNDSPLMTGARARAAGASNARGLLNSSIGVQAGEEAAYGAALPIASADASTNFAAKQANQNAGNRAFEFTAGAGNTIAGQQLAGEQNLSNIGAQGEQTRLNIGSQAEAERGLIGSRLGAEQVLQTQRGAQALEQVGAQGTQVRLTAAQQAQAESSLLAQKGQIDLQLQSADAATRAQLLQQQGQIESQLQQLRGTQASDLQRLKADADTTLQTLRGTQAERIAELEGTYRELLQTVASATSMYGGIAKNISDAMNNPEMDEATKQLAIDRNIDLLESGLSIIGGIIGFDPPLTTLLNFGTTPP